MNAIDENEFDVLNRIAATGVAWLDGGDNTVAKRLARRGLVRAIGTHRADRPIYFAASGAGIAVLNEDSRRARDMRRSYVGRRRCAPPTVALDQRAV